MASEWYVGRNGQQSGPFSTGQLKDMAAAGQLAAGDLLWKQGLESWVPVSKVKGLRPVEGGGTLPPLDLGTPGGLAGDARVRGDAARATPGSGLADDNPYRASAAAAAGPAVAPAASSDMVYAEFLPRVGAYLLDAIFMGVIGMILQFGMMLMFGFAAGGDEAVISIGSLLGSLLSFVITLVYFVAYETSAKQGTWGKQIVGIRVTDLQGRPITTGRAIGRFFAKIISGFTCGIGYLLPLFLDKKQTLHDLIAGCLALKK
jgi:uncharacterized RDD family membrane protein YckC